MSIPEKDALSPNDGLLTMLDLSNDGLHILDLKGNLVYSNAAFLNLLGYSIEESKSLHVRDWDINFPEDQIQPTLARIFDSAITFETIHQRKDGSQIEVEINAKGITLDGRRYISASARDISERKRHERALIDSEARAAQEAQRATIFREMIEQASDCFYIANMDENMCMTAVNEATVRHFGVSRDEIYSWSLPDWDPKYTHDDIPALINNMKSAQRMIFDSIHKLPDGTIVPVEISVNHYVDKTGTNLAFGWFRDISERQRTEQLQEDAIQRAKAANKAKSAFLATMSHEIRTPLTGIIGYADLLLDEDIPDHSLEKVLQIKQSSKFLLRLLNDVLDVSKLEAGKLDIEKISFDLPQTIKDVFDTFAKQWQTDSPVQWVLNIDDTLPPYIRTDPTRLRQILINLLGNAQKFTHKGSVELVCQSATAADGTPILDFKVKDSGIGMTPDVRAAIFSEFTQADPSITRKYEGTGLGLAICKKLANLMGGDIGVDSTPGQGSTFWFKIPYQKGEKPAEKCKKSVSASKFSAIRPLRILLAEDNQINQRLIKKFLDKYGHNVSVANNGQEAVVLQQQEDFDLILMDIRMPEMDGIQATKAIRALTGEKADIPIIAVTADAVQDHIYEFMAAGMDAYVYKPINWTQLILTINQVMQSNIHVINEETYA